MTELTELLVRKNADNHDIDPLRAGQELARHVVQCDIAAVAALTDLAGALFTVPDHVTNGMRVISVQITPSSTITASDAEYKTLTVTKVNAAGAGSATVCSVAVTVTGGTAGDLPALVPYSMSVTTTLADATLVAGGGLLLSAATTTGGGAGQALPRSVVTLVLEEL